MGSDYVFNKEDKLDFKQIVLGHYKRILEISTMEFMGGYFNYVWTEHSSTKQYVTDKRKEFIQAVESLSNALFPYFDEEMKEHYKIYLDGCKKLLKEYGDEEGFIRADEENSKVKHSVKKLILVEELFRNLSCLMHRLDYFKGAIYGEVEEDLFDVDGGKENE